MSDIKNKLFESEWDATWEHLEAQPWYPDEQVVRFLSAYSSRRVGFGPGDVRFVNGKQPKGLDIGCGKGRHLITMAELNIEACGVDLSTVGVNFAREWMNSRKFTAVIEKSPMSKLPFPDDEFDFVICHGVLDHMTLSERTAGILETCRVLRQGGLFFFSVISKNDSAYGEGTYVEDDTWLIEDGFEKNAPQAFLMRNALMLSLVRTLKH